MAALVQPVRTDHSLVSGVETVKGAIVSFKGIPFAAPPVGQVRWRAPKPPMARQGTDKADTFSASCIQKIVTERKPWTHEFIAHDEIGQDCLYLNVWTPAKTAADKLPVFVWIYGGALVEGSTAVKVYDGEGLSSKGLVGTSRPSEAIHGGLPSRVSRPARARSTASRPAGTPDTDRASQIDSARQQTMVSMYLWGRNRQKTGKSPLYTYYWDHPEPGPDQARYAAFHTSEVPYVLHTLSKSDRPWTAADRKIEEAMSSYRANFARTGDPNGKGLTHWAAFDHNNKTTMELGDKPGARPLADPAKFDLFARYFARSKR